MKKVCLLLIFSIFIFHTKGQISLDPSFASKGFTTTSFSKGKETDYSERSRQVLYQTSGHLIVVFEFDDKTLLARYSSDGALDNSFGIEGYSTIVNLLGPKAALQNDGKIVVVGYSISNSTTDFAVVRYNPDGSLDNSFDGDGKVTTDIGSTSSIDFHDYATSLVVQSNEKIVVVGYSTISTGTTDFAVVRYNPDGSLDNSFDGDGKVTTNFGSYYCMAYSVALQSDGKIVLAGVNNTFSGTIYDFALVRYNVDGSLDNSFDGDGKLTTDLLGSVDIATSIGVQSDGKIITGGYGRNPSNGTDDFAVVRYNPDGSLDNSFDGDGKVLTDFNNWDYPISLAIESAEKIVLAGYSRNMYSGLSDFAVVRYNPDGSLDNSFDGDGKVTTDLGSVQDYANSLALQSDGKLVVVGSTYNQNESANDIAVVRYNPDGSLDNSFDGDGKLITYVVRSRSEFHDLAVQSDGKIIAAGYTWNFNTNSSEVTLARYNPDGSFDNSFDEDGKVIIPNFSAFLSNILEIQLDGKIVVAGHTNNPLNGPDFAVVRYNPDGSLDNSFGGDGLVTTDLGTTDEASSLTIQADGKIVLIGYSAHSEGYYIAVVRYNPDGSLDNSFGGDGKVLTSLPTYTEIYSLSIQNDGKILGAGYTSNPSVINSQNFAVVRYNPDGSLDNSFGGDGLVTTDIQGSEDLAFSMIQQSDGKILLAGHSSNPFGLGYDFAVVRYNPDGSLDNSFGGDGKVLTDFGTYNDFGTSLTLQNNGKILVTGMVYNTTNGTDDFAVVRYNPDGSLDNSFDGDGKVLTDLGMTSDYAYNIKTNTNRFYIVGGRWDINGRSVLAAYSLNCENNSYYIDNDGDGYGNSNIAAQEACSAPSGYVSQGGDCADSDPAINPDAIEICDGKDNDCDGEVDEEVKTTFYLDSDGDGYGDASKTTEACQAPTGYVDNFGDCNDQASSVYPGAPEICGNGVDDNCNQETDEACPNKALLSIGDVTVQENQGTGTPKAMLKVRLSKKVDKPVTVNYATADGTARSKSTKNNPADFTSVLSQVTIPAFTQEATITIDLINSTANEPTEYFYVNLSRALNAAISDGSATVTILDGAASAISSDITRTKANTISELDGSYFAVRVLNNPSQSQFTLNTQSGYNQLLSIRVMDNLGRVIERRNSVGANSTFTLGGNYRPGVYYVEATQGNERRMLKLVKQ
jgi:uncharacterized delta-60 repeat protein